MRIRLINFRCYTDKTFNLGENGMTLLSGSSGVGKSTVMMGIQFALFGVGTKLISHGQNSCRVELEFEDMRIVRSKRPNRLVVTCENTYEDHAAQAVIDKKFGETFSTTGYISQGAFNSFVMLSPIDKLSFLEQFAFGDVNLSEIKSRIKALIKEKNDELVASAAKLDMARGVLESLFEPEIVIFPVKCPKSKRDKVIKNETIKIKNCGTRIKRAQRSIKKLREQLTALKVYETETNTKEEFIGNIDKKLLELEERKEEIFFIGDTELQQHRKTLEAVVCRKELSRLEEKYTHDQSVLEDMIKKEKDELLEEINKINNELYQEYTPETLKETISEYKVIIEDLDKIDRLKKSLNKTNESKEELLTTLNDYNQELLSKKELLTRLKQQRDVYSCPNCNHKVHILDNSLCLVDEDDIDPGISISIVKEDIQLLTSNIQKIENKVSKTERNEEIEENIKNIEQQYETLPDLEETKQDLEYLREYKASQQELEKKKDRKERNLDKEQFSSSLTMFKQDIEKQTRRINELQEQFTEIIEESTEEELREIIELQSQNKERLTEINNATKELNKEKISYMSRLEGIRQNYLEAYGDFVSEDEINDSIFENENKIEQEEKQREECSKILEQINKFLEYERELETYRGWESKIIELEQQVEVDQKQYAASLQFKEKILESESIATANVISSINSHAQVYLECFFPDNPINVRLTPFKETKKLKKPQINLEIEYKEMDCTLDSLSGGELSRVILAFTLALAEMSSTPLVMLDECTSSLDQELNGTVIDGIKQHYNGKLVLLISHQSVCGIYDKVIDL